MKNAIEWTRPDSPEQHAFKIFVQENERMRQYLSAIESMVREMEAMTVSMRSQQTDMHDFFASARCG